MRLKFIDSIRSAFSLLRDGRLSKAIQKAYLLVSKIRNVLKFLDTTDNEKLSSISKGVSVGLDNIEKVLVKILRVFNSNTPVTASSASTLQEALAELDRACKDVEETASDLPVVLAD
jgi:hypothetical protein